MAWYPIKARGPVARFHDDLTASGIRRILAAELTVWPEDDPARLNGCGLILFNPPWQAEVRIAALLAALHGVLARQPGGGSRVAWLVPE
jgi:23S rRNA (adenine2030-N6)-methyltransferase